MGILFLPARQGRCSGLLFCSAVRPLLLRLIPTTDTATLDSATLASGATEDMALDTDVDTPPLDTPDLATAVATSEDTATAVVTDTTVKSVKSTDQHNAALPCTGYCPCSQLP